MGTQPQGIRGAPESEIAFTWGSGKASLGRSVWNRRVLGSRSQQGQGPGLAEDAIVVKGKGWEGALQTWRSFKVVGTEA